jgi:hypothetical protein
MKTILAVSAPPAASIVSGITVFRPIRKFAAALALAMVIPLLCTRAFAQTGTPQQTPLTQADAPAYTVGEQWTFDMKNELEPSKNATFTQTVTRIGDGRVELDGGAATLDANGNYVMNASSTFIPNDCKLHFPMHVGDTWSSSFTYKNGTIETTNQRDAKVVSVERVDTAAGSFDTFRVEQVGSWRPTDGGKAHGSVEETDWYAPSVGRIVKMDYANRPAKGAQTTLHIELTAFKSATVASAPRPASQ